MRKTFPSALALLAALSLLVASPAWCDEITDQIERAVKLYKDGKLSEALSEMEFATAQLRQKKAEALSAIFPAAPEGWKAEKAESQAIAQAMFGGGITAERVYRNQKGPGKVKIELISDSPWLQTLAMVITNPMMAQSQGGKLIRVGEEKALLNVRDKRAELQMSIDNKVLLKVEAEGGDKSEELAKDFAGKIDLAKLRSLSR